MTLIEVVVAMTIFTMLALSITASVIQSQRISQNNILINTGFTIAQGYLEQIKSIAPSEIEAALLDPEGTPLPTQSISALKETETEIDDPLFLDGPDRNLGGQTDGSNKKEVLLDLKESPDGTQREVTMDAWFDVDIEDMENQSYSYSIEIHFEVRTRGSNSNLVRGVVRGVRADIN